MELFEQARTYAVVAHGEQKYGDLPYSSHLDEVHNVLIEFGFTDPILRAAAYLHDTVEDTDTTLDELGWTFPAEVVYVVDGVTTVKIPGSNRKTRNTATYPRIAECVSRIKVKLADRIANTRHSLKDNANLFSMYKKEYPGFRAALFTSHEEVAPMWAELDRLMGESK